MSGQLRQALVMAPVVEYFARSQCGMSPRGSSPVGRARPIPVDTARVYTQLTVIRSFYGWLLNEDEISKGHAPGAPDTGARKHLPLSGFKRDPDDVATAWREAVITKSHPSHGSRNLTHVTAESTAHPPRSRAS